MKIPFGDLKFQFEAYQNEYETAALEVLRSGWYVLGKHVSSFETEFADYLGVKHAVGLASGLDALILAFRTLGIGRGDEVIVQGNAYIACVMGITANKAKPVFVEPDKYHNLNPDLIEEKITKKTKAILVVHLYGQASRMDKIMSIAKKYNLKVVEDCAQSHGAKFNGQLTGTFGDINCFSFYPSKNLGAFGDGGAIVTNNLQYAEHIKMLRNYGSSIRYYFEEVGLNSRLDELQAALLSVKLKHLSELTAEREKIANNYIKSIKNKSITLPLVAPDATAIWHLFVIYVKGDRKKLIDYLNKNEIGTVIHYPQPPHLSQAYEYLKMKKGDLPLTEDYADHVLSLPIYNGMPKSHQDFVIKKLNEYK